MRPGDDDSIRDVRMSRFADAACHPGTDRVVREEPLEIQIGPTPVAVVMRTPGADVELATGFLVTERVVERPEDVTSVRHCSLASDPEAADNVIRATLADGVEVDWERLRRNLYASSSCGICGKATIENALASAPPLDDPLRLPAEILYRLPERMRGAQSVFEATGGLHAAALFAGDGSLLALREDVGRHNAVDKLVGWAVREGRLPLAGHVLLVSGRVSYEIVQKALAARIPLLAAVSAPSSLALELAASAGITLVGFLRGRALNVYANRERVLG